MTESRLNLRPGTSYPDIPLFQGWGEPSRIEADVHELESYGQVPADLDGRYYRAAYDWAFPPMAGDEELFINGDGMTAMFHFRHGHVDFKSRFVRTEKFRLERAARRALFGRYRNVFTADPTVRGRVRSTANTHVVWHGGKLLMLKEDGLPWEMDPETLETVGQWDFHGAMTSETCTAHPSFDPDTGEMFLFGYEAKGEATRDIAYYVVDASGHVTHESWFEAPYASYIHDFRVSRGHAVFPVSPVVADLDRMKAGGEHWQWDAGKASYIGVLPRYGRGDDIRWIEVPTHAPGHFVNSYDEDGITVVDLCQGKKGPFPFFFPDVQGDMFDPADMATCLTRWRIDPNDAATPVRVERLDEVVCELPQIDARLEMSRHRHGYFVVMNAGMPTGRLLEAPGRPPVIPDGDPDLVLAPSGMNGIGHYDFEKGQFTVHALPAGDTAQEVEFVPAHPGAPEGVGYLLALVNRVSERHSDLLVFDAEDVGAGPLGGYKLPLRLSTIHGTWVPEHQLAL
ncbi:carotenoid oxygenase family protein [Streptomyces europaeiscabiei]|uniref:Dioxygenase n=1 Tax=Streptomyces europaeiscabiei TaxID=146819 RepID=A0AAJ2PQD3_9ACTN|nr:carotenoid oxygenase family protein [Streptomyces europaeiscabiei]MDX3131378.1 carotenoid oxygenase family protein [Streptomyces europaeiscabiei]